MRSSTKRFISLLIALIFAALTVVVYVSFLNDAFKQVAQLRGKIDAESQLLSDQNNSIGKFKNLLTTYSSQYAALDKTLSTALPTKEEVPTVVNQIQTLSRVSSLALQSLTLKYAPLTPAKKGASTLVKPIGTLNVTVQAAGSYENLKAFLRALETNIRVMDISSLKIDGVRQGDAVVSNTFLFSVEIATYYQ